MAIAYENILEVEGVHALIEADKDMKELNELQDNERMVYLIEGINPDEVLMSVTRWCDGTVTVFCKDTFDSYEREDWETGMNELYKYMDENDRDEGSYLYGSNELAPDNY